MRTNPDPMDVKDPMFDSERVLIQSEAQAIGERERRKGACGQMSTAIYPMHWIRNGPLRLGSSSTAGDQFSDSEKEADECEALLEFTSSDEESEDEVIDRNSDEQNAAGNDTDSDTESASFINIRTSHVEDN